VTEDALHRLCLADPLWVERYEGWHELGHGGSATVVRTRSRALDQEIALKVFLRLSADDWRRVQSEVQNAQRLTSPYVVRTYSPFPRGTVSWIEQEFVDGPNLRQALEERAHEGRPFDLDPALDIGVAVARALAAAHEAGVVHRDVKPANVLLPRSASPAAKLGDFGISRLAGAGRITATGLLAGTPQFAAPEVVGGQPATAASDVYSLSLCLYLIASNDRFPFRMPEDASAAQWMKAHVDTPPLPVTAFRPAAPLALQEILARGLAKDPRQRPTADEVAQAFTVLRGLPAGRRASAPRPASSRPASWMMAGLAGGVLVGALVLLRGGSWGPRVSGDTPPSTSLAGRPAPAAVAIAPPDPASRPTSLAVPSSSPAPLGAVGRGPFRATVQDDLLKIANVGQDPAADLSITLVGAGGERHVAESPGILGARQDLFLPLDSFTPTPPPGFRPVRVEISRAGGPSGDVRYRLPLH
jgi:serine/threonine-protein kinase